MLQLSDSSPLFFLFWEFTMTDKREIGGRKEEEVLTIKTCAFAKFFRLRHLRYYIRSWWRMVVGIKFMMIARSDIKFVVFAVYWTFFFWNLLSFPDLTLQEGFMISFILTFLIQANKRIWDIQSHGRLVLIKFGIYSGVKIWNFWDCRVGMLIAEGP